MTTVPSKRPLPNWALGALLGGLVVGTYVYSIRAVGDDSAEVAHFDKTSDLIDTNSKSFSGNLKGRQEQHSVHLLKAEPSLLIRPSLLVYMVARNTSKHDQATKAFDTSLSVKKLGRKSTDFELRVYKAICRIPEGKVTTYGELAKYLNTSSRAIGQALRRNPYAPEVPCHRIVKGDLSIGGFSGTQGQTAQVAKKMALLKKEGVEFNARSVASPDFVLKGSQLSVA